MVEAGDARAVLDNPTHPYSIALKNAVLPPDPKKAAEAVVHVPTGEAGLIVEPQIEATKA